MVTVHDVARTAGVSIATVSRALSNPSMVATATRERVESAAAALGYVPNLQAAALRAGRTGAIGLLVPDLANPYFAAIAQGVAETAREQGLGVFVVDSQEDPEAEPGLLRRLARQTDGVILASPRAVEADRAVAGTTPVVVVNQTGPRAVAADFASGVHQAVAHLVALGHRQIAYVGGPAASWGDAQRRTALAAEVRDRGADGLEVLLLGVFAPTVDGGESAVDAVAASSATAVVTYNDVVAVGLVRALRARGVRVPDDLSVVSFDDTYLAGLVTPALTSVRTDLRALGRFAARQLVEPTDAAEPLTLHPMHLEVRDSTATPRA
ncbi:LacI family DNA-binding transcriptional regulator [Xylanimonas protaetiae]|uniref:LacI family transcriptional regulator n=1 Tax=Xylanimonas protaetiae TaxID=2509457 RepID=A0A4P6F1H8_9MICO|nr:LacI family DNA-binding transcriptional regulator [Xylanimonas protaetiae]QAY68975.1 LacI family transcriptional regulator [Xylanimonas protaetiae]